MKKRTSDYGKPYFPKHDYHRTSKEAFGAFFPHEREPDNRALGGVLIIVAIVIVVFIFRQYAS